MAALELENRRLTREITRIKQVTNQDRAAYAALLNHEKTKAFLNRERARYFALLLAHTPDIILVLRNSGRLEFCSQYFADKAQIDSDNILGHMLTDVLQPYMDKQDLDALMHHKTDAALSKTCTTLETSFTFGGVKRKFEGQIIPITDRDINPGGTMMVFSEMP